MAAVALSIDDYFADNMPTAYTERSADRFLTDNPTSGFCVNFVRVDATGAFIAKMVSANDVELNEAAVELNYLQQAFGLNKSQMADALFVTRKTVYNWLDEITSPQPENRDRINFLKEIADYYIEKEPLNRIGKLRVAINGTSIYQLLLDESVSKEAFITFINQLGQARDMDFHRVANANAINALRTKKVRPVFS